MRSPFASAVRAALPATLLLVGLASGPARAADGPVFRIDHAAARVVVIPEARSDVVFTIRQGRKDLPPIRARQDGGVQVLDGGIGFGVVHLFADLNCHGSGDGASVGIVGHGRVPVSELAVVTVRTPLNARIQAGGAIFGEVAPSDSLDLGAAGCGDWRLRDVRGDLRVGVSGSGDVHGAAAGNTHVGISGSGDVFLGPVRALNAHVAGSGSVKVASAQGPIEANISGSGDIVVEHGSVPSMQAAIAGSGNIRFGGDAGDLRASIAGSGDIDVAKVDGHVSRHVAGSGSVNVGGR